MPKYTDIDNRDEHSCQFIMSKVRITQYTWFATVIVGSVFYTIFPDLKEL